MRTEYKFDMDGYYMDGVRAHGVINVWGDRSRGVIDVCGDC